MFGVYCYLVFIFVVVDWFYYIIRGFYKFIVGLRYNVFGVLCIWSCGLLCIVSEVFRFFFIENVMYCYYGFFCLLILMMKWSCIIIFIIVFGDGKKINW